MVKKTNKTVKQKMRQKRKIRKEEEAVAHLDSFFSEVSGLTKSHVDNLSNFTEKKNRPNAKHSSAKTNTVNSKVTRHFPAVNPPVKKIDIKIKTRGKNGTEKNANTSDRPNKSTSTPPVNQETLNHKNCFALEEESKFNSIWMGSDADWTALNIHLGMDPAKALKQAEKALEHYRTKLNDFWNIHGLTAGQGYGVDGQPWCTSHYSFHMVLWHIPLALSGQRYNAVKQLLTFEPNLRIPYNLPFFTPFASGTVQARKLKERIKYTVTVTSGRLELKFLAVSKSMFPKKTINLSQGEYVSWERE